MGSLALTPASPVQLETRVGDFGRVWSTFQGCPMSPHGLGPVRVPGPWFHDQARRRPPTGLDVCPTSSQGPGDSSGVALGTNMSLPLLGIIPLGW